MYNLIRRTNASSCLQRMTGTPYTQRILGSLRSFSTPAPWSSMSAAPSTSTPTVIDTNTTQQKRAADSLRDRCRDALGHVAWPVAVVTAKCKHSGQTHGMTVGSFASASLDPHPVVSFGVRLPSRMHDTLLQASEFYVHVLSEKQKHISHIFASNHIERDVEETDAMLAELDEQACCVLRCEEYSTHPIQDHVMWYAGVKECSSSSSSLSGEQLLPLSYYKQRYTTIVE